MTTELIVGFSAAAIAFLIIWAIKGVLLTPVCKGKNTDIVIKVNVSRYEPELEHTLNGLIWLIDNGTLKAKISIVLNNTDEATEHIAEIYSRKFGFITIT